MVLPLCIIFSLLGTTTTVPMTPCNNKIKIGDQWYERDVLWAFIGRPTNLIVHKVTNTLFFSYSLPDTYSEVDFQLAFINIDSRDSQIIAGIRGGCAIAIDEANDKIYLGGSDGIFTYNMLTKIGDFYKESSKNIWSLYFKKNLFYISYPDQRLHIEVDGRFSNVTEFENFEVDQFFIKSNHDIYFSNKTGFFYLNNQDSLVHLINDLITVRQISEDSEGNMYLTTNVGVFSEGKYEKMNKILSMKNIYGLTFDRDNNYIISDSMSVMKLTKSDESCYNNKGTHW